jgi:CO/xanthine dehydrogenase Mo-binding subunit
MMTSLIVEKVEKWVGKPLKRVEDLRLIKGKGTFVEDIKLPNQTYAAILRSSYAHAKIKSIDYSKAVKMPGVILVFTGTDIAKLTDPSPR